MNVKELSNEADFLLHTLDRGVINIPEIKSFLAKVAAGKPPSARRQTKMERLAKLNARIK